MRSHPWLHRRNATYYMRAIVPSELVKKLGRAEIWKSLRTSDRSQALLKLHPEAARLELQFEAMRTNGAAKELVNQDHLLSIARRYATGLRLDRSKEFQNKKIDLWSADEREAELKLHLDHYKYYKQILDDRTFDSLEHDLDILLAREGLQLEKGCRDWELLGEAILKEILRDITIQIQFYTGQVTPSEVFKPEGQLEEIRPKSASTTIGQLINLYKSEYSGAWTHKSSIQYETVFRLIVEHFGKNTPLSEIDRIKCRAFRDKVLWLPPNRTKSNVFRSLTFDEAVELNEKKSGDRISISTAETYLNTFSSLFRFGVHEELVERNPAEALLKASFKNSRVKYEKAMHAERKRRPFNIDELNTIFNSGAYLDQASDSAFRWLPLLGLFQGFRMNEALQLEPNDAFFRDNVYCLHISEDYSGDQEALAASGFRKRVKTKQSDRVVPVHPELLRLGFREFCTKMQESNSLRLFPDVAVGASGYFSDIFSKTFARFLDRIGLKSKSIVFHSFRHNFRDAARAARIPQEIIFQLGGWKGGHIGNDYGEGYTLPDLLCEIRKIQYLGLKLGP